MGVNTRYAKLVKATCVCSHSVSLFAPNSPAGCFDGVVWVNHTYAETGYVRLLHEPLHKHLDTHINGRFGR